jgi:hypothetical protein
MTAENLIFADPYSTLWPSTMLRWLNFMSLTRLRVIVDPLQGIGSFSLAVFNTFYINPKENVQKP